MVIIEKLVIIIGCLALILLLLIVYIAYKDFTRIFRRNHPTYPNDYIFEPRSSIPSYHDATKGDPPRYDELVHFPPPYTV